MALLLHNGASLFFLSKEGVTVLTATGNVWLWLVLDDAGAAAAVVSMRVVLLLAVVVVRAGVVKSAVVVAVVADRLVGGCGGVNKDDNMVGEEEEEGIESVMVRSKTSRKSQCQRSRETRTSPQLRECL